MSSNRRAEEVFAAAEKLEKKWSMFSKEDNWNKAAEDYGKAANLFKSSECYGKAAEAFGRAYELYTKLGDVSDANRALSNKALCLSKSEDPIAAVAPLEEVVENYISAGHFSQAAKTQHEIAKVYEEAKKYDKAVEAYNKAASQYELENRPASAQPFRVSAAKLSALNEDYVVAYQSFDTLGNSALNSGAMRFGAKEHFINAILCQIANDDEIGAEKSVTQLDEFDRVIAEYTRLKQVDEFRRQIIQIIRERLVDSNLAVTL
ncbi:Soluble nsf attacment protein [Entamoeba marina]